jgi:RES domain-containing protein
VRFEGICYRGHDPRWAFSPLSGEGARQKGGRFNPIGQEALYLSLTIEGMFLEQSHGLLHRFNPLTACCYEVDVSDIVDLRTEVSRASFGVDLAELSCPWRLDLADGREPASWKVAKRLIIDKVVGLLVPSFARGARADLHHNLVLWRWGANLPYRVAVYDPSSRLPRN